MAGGTRIHQQILIGVGPDRRAHDCQTGNKLRYGQLELADQHTAGGGHNEAHAVLPGGQRQCEIGHQQRLAHLGFAPHKQNALRRQ